MTKTDYICKEKNEQEDSPALKIASMYRYDDSKTTKKKNKERLITTTIGELGTVPEVLEIGIGTAWNRKKNWNHSDYNIIEINQITQKSRGDMRRLVISQTQVKVNQQTFVWKTC